MKVKKREKGVKEGENSECLGREREKRRDAQIERERERVSLPMCSRLLVLACLAALATAQLVLEDEPGAALMEGADGDLKGRKAERREATDPMTRMLQWGMENSDLSGFAQKAQLIRESPPGPKTTVRPAGRLENDAVPEAHAGPICARDVTPSFPLIFSSFSCQPPLATCSLDAGTICPLTRLFLCLTACSLVQADNQFWP